MSAQGSNLKLMAPPAPHPLETREEVMAGMCSWGDVRHAVTLSAW